MFWAPGVKEITTTAIKNFLGAGSGRAALLKKQDKCICDCTICHHIPLKDVIFFVFSIQTTSKSQLKKPQKSTVKLHLPKPSAKFISSLLGYTCFSPHYYNDFWRRVTKQTFGWIHQPFHHTQSLKVSKPLFLLSYSCPNYEEESKCPRSV